MNFTLTHLVIFLQIPIVFFLVLVNNYARTHLSKIAFRIMTYAWIANLIYLVYCLVFSKFNRAYPEFIIPFFDSASAFLFYCSTLLKAKKEYLLRNNRKTVFLLTLVFLILYLLIQASTHFFIPNDKSGFQWGNIPSIVLNFYILLKVGNYFKLYKGKLVKVKWLTISFYIYSVIQILAVFPNWTLFSLQPWVIDVQAIGFSLGFIAKSLILYSFINVLLLLITDLQKLQTKLEYRSVLTIKLNQIIGRTFHEITPVVAQMENQIVSLLVNQHEFQISKKVISSIQEMENTTYRIRTIIAAATKMYYNDMKDEPSNEKYTYPIQILSKEEILNINTIIEIAITNFKAYISILRNSDIDYYDLEKNFLTTNDVRFTTEYAGNCLVYANAADLVQVFYNAFKNSYEAMYDVNDKCHIFIKTKNEIAEQTNPDERAGKYVRIEVEDNGIGIPTEIQTKIFDSGFSTKNDETGRGRGFGMDIIKSTTEQFNGTILIESPIIQSRVQNLNGRGGTKLIFKFPKEKQ